MNTPSLDRRSFLIGTVLAGAAGLGGAASRHDGGLGAPSETLRGGMPWMEGTADAPPGVSGTDFRFFTAAERAFIEAAVNRLIPNDDIGPGAVEANVPFFIDRQLAGQFGRGEHFYLGGPWKKGVPEQGYQSRYSPAQLYRAAIKAIDAYTAKQFGGKNFAALSESDRDQLLKDLEAGKVELEDGVDAKTFFTMLLQNTKEGYFSDPIYGGNRDMGAWKMIGFPGAHYDYSEWVTRHGEKVPLEPVSFKGRRGWREA
ncbi:MAG TPA: gluconate 2-dehydrogenase subunit 3 family protein [Rudaea sp.]|nr:gluconate 2-dehydrogenase subunit 3 family protein [Rudaea sp.]